MSIFMNFAFRLDKTLLNRGMAVSRREVGVPASPSYFILLPPTAVLSLFLSFFICLIVYTTRECVVSFALCFDTLE